MPRLQCVMCSASFFSAKLLERHCAKVHNGVKIPRNEEYTDELEETASVVTEHPSAVVTSVSSLSNVMACSACGKVFDGENCKEWLVDHLRIEHLDQPPHSCLRCSMRFVYRDSLLEHQRAMHIMDESLAETKQVSYNELKDLSMSQDDDVSYCCGVCNVTYERLSELLQHFAESHPQMSAEEEPVPNFQCTLCSVVVPGLAAGELHVQTNHPNIWKKCIQCPLCGLESENEMQNHRHLVQSHCRTNMVPSCQICKKTEPMNAEQLAFHYTGEHAKTVSEFLTLIDGGAAGDLALQEHSVLGDESRAMETLYECAACRARYPNRAELDKHFQNGCDFSGTIQEAGKFISDEIVPADAYLQHQQIPQTGMSVGSVGLS